MDPKSKLDMSLDEIVKINSHYRNKGVKRLDQNRRHSFPAGQRQQNGRMRNNYNNNNNNNNNFKPRNSNNNFNNRPSLSNRSKGIVQIGNLSPEVDEADLMQLFNTVGDIEKVEVMYDGSGASRGIAKITFRQLQSAMDAIEMYNNVRLDSKFWLCFSFGF